ncbi:MAG: hypothetical protein Q6K14_04470, partial [Gloeomargarita sp. GMQP_bins_44]
CVQCNRTIEFTNTSILKTGIKQAEKEGLHLLDCQLTIHAICPEALRRGWPSLLPSNWVCPRALNGTVTGVITPN